MNRNLYQTRKSSISSRIFLLLKLQRICAGLALVVSISGTAAAQYPGGGGGTSNYPGGTRPSYGSKGAVIGGVAAGATVGAGLLYWKLHNRTKLQGCVAGEGDKLISEKTNQTYNLTNNQEQSLKPGEHVELVGKKTKDSLGEPTFEVYKMSKDLGQCAATTAEQR
jgi:hypothetical protein